jgi:translation initiation factor IF-2
MRARGAKATDIVILVVAADDGVMPQTEEAVQHARAASVPLVVAINKIDKEGADPDRIKTALSSIEVVSEDWGGDVQFVPVSAKTGVGIDALLDAVLLEAEVLELTAVPEAPAKGVVIEARLDKGRGVVTTLLIQNGTLQQGDIVLAGQQFGRVRAMLDENGRAVKVAGPSIPVEILGLNGTPDSGDDFTVVHDEKKAREVALFRQGKCRDVKLARQQSAKLDTILANMGKEQAKVLHVVLKADVRGSLEALTSSLTDLGTEEVKVHVIYGGVGGIAESDVNLAVASNAFIFGFNVRTDGPAKQLITKTGVDLRYYSVIYDMINDVKQVLSGMLSPHLREQILGVAEVRDVFHSPKLGLIAGCMVTEGTVFRHKPIRVLRDNVVIYSGELESLRRYKDTVQEVRHGMECGIGVKSYNDVKIGDQIEIFDTVEVQRSL